VGLGVASYRLRAYLDAIQTLEQATDRDPFHAPARIFLALAYLRQGDVSRAAEELAAYRRLTTAPQAAAQVDQALGQLGAGGADAEQRAAIAAGLEETAARELDRR
jgi:cytochrome c-type biogenesis protein CcmH/NrfG